MGTLEPAALHDAILGDLNVSWPLGMASLAFSPVTAAPVVLRATGLQRLALTRELPWGPSQLVNTVSAGKDRDCQMWSIELQSGDTIEIKAATIELQVNSEAT